MHKIIDYSLFFTSDSDLFLTSDSKKLNVLPPLIEDFLTSDSKTFFDFDGFQFLSRYSYYQFDEVATQNSFSNVDVYSTLYFTVDGFQNLNILNGLSWIPLPYTFNIYGLVSSNSFSDLRIGKVSGIWFSGEYAENIWTKKTKTTTSWEVK